MDTTSSLKELNTLRKPDYYKDPAEEEFLLNLNRLLMVEEIKRYKSYPERFPFLFVFGLPRSGTTLLAQLIAHSFDVGYINNFMARFWLAPVTGVKLSRIILGQRTKTDFQSNYATTNQLTDIHEFGYFWRHWLKKETIDQITHARAQERTIDWSGLKNTLLNIQHEFDKPMVFKNIFGAYHIRRLVDLLAKVLFIYIERNPLDVAISIRDARQAFYDNLDAWWSTYPPEYNMLKDQPHMKQIGGQVYYLRRFYEAQMEALEGNSIVKISYRSLCSNPSGVLKRIYQAGVEFCTYELERTNPPPSRFEYRQYEDRESERRAFRTIIDSLESDEYKYRGK